MTSRETILAGGNRGPAASCRRIKSTSFVNGSRTALARLNYIIDFLAYADVGTVIHPRALGGQILGRSTLGIAHAIGQKWVFDPHYGEMVAKRFHHNKPPTILDVPVNM